MESFVVVVHVPSSRRGEGRRRDDGAGWIRRIRHHRGGLVEGWNTQVSHGRSGFDAGSGGRILPPIIVVVVVVVAADDASIVSVERNQGWDHGRGRFNDGRGEPEQSGQSQ